MSSDPHFPLPDTDWPPLREFWEGAAAGELRIPRCGACARFCWYPPERCSHCGSQELAFVPVSGRGTLFSWAVVHRALFEPYRGQTPYLTGLVALDEDPEVRIVTRFVDCEADALRAGLPVRAVFRPLRFEGVPGEVPAPFFTPLR